MAENSSNQLPTNEISPKQVIVFINNSLKKALRNKVLFIICLIAGIAFGGVLSTLLPVNYVATISLMIDEGEKNGGGLGSAAGIASQFGINLGDMGGKGGLKEENVEQLVKTRLVLEQAFMTPIKEPSMKLKPLLGNFWLEKMGFRNNWIQNERKDLESFYFSPANTGKSKYIQDSLLQVFTAIMFKNYVTYDKASKQSDFLVMTVTMPQDSMAKYVTESLISALTEVYTNRKTQKARWQLNLIENRVDSIRSVLFGTERASAQAREEAKRSVVESGFLRSDQLDRQKAILIGMYQEAIKNLEIAKTALSNQTPVFQIYDRPVFPIPKKETLSLKLGLIIGFILGGLSFLVVSRNK